jgi:hypothetical protein
VDIMVEVPDEGDDDDDDDGDEKMRFYHFDFLSQRWCMSRARALSLRVYY